MTSDPPWWRPAWALLGIPALVAVVTGLPSLLYPHGRDQGNYATAGWVWMEGGALYRDVISFKPPGAAWIHGLSQLLFGVRPVAIRLFDLGWTAASASAVAWLTWRLFGRRDAAVFAGVAYPLLYWPTGYWNTSQPDAWLGLPSILAVLLVLLGSDAYGRRTSRLAAALWFGAGACSALAVLFKYTAGWIAIPMLLAFGHAALLHGAGVFRGVAWVILGGLTPLVATVGGLVARDAWPAFAEVQFDLVPNYVRNTAKERVPARFLGLTGDASWRFHPALWVALLAFVPATLWVRRAGRATQLGFATIVLWWAGAAASVLMQQKFYPYHYQPMAPSAAICTGLALTWITSRPRPWSAPLQATLGAAAVVAVMALSPLRKDWVDLYAVVTGSSSVADVWASRSRYRGGGWPVDEMRRLAQHIRETTDPEDAVFVWGYAPAVHILAQRRPASRVIYTYPLAVPWSDHGRWMSLLLSDLRASRPPVFVVAHGDATPGVTQNRKDSRRLLLALPELHGYLRDNYRFEHRIGHFGVWRRGQRP